MICSRGRLVVAMVGSFSPLHLFVVIAAGTTIDARARVRHPKKISAQGAASDLVEVLSVVQYAATTLGSAGQMDVGQRDTGLDCLTLLLRFHQVAVDPAQIAHQLAGEPVGVTEMLRCARQLKLKARAVRQTWGGLAKLPLPAIVARSDGSFAILGQVTAEAALIQDGLRRSGPQRRIGGN